MSLRTATKTLWIASLLSCGLGTAFAAEPPPSEASLRELMSVTRVQNMLKEATGQVDGYMENAMNEALEGTQISQEQRQIIDEMRTRIQTLLKESLQWKEFEPIVLDVYKRTFTQREVDGMIAFYKTEAGKALVEKMPLVTDNTMQAMQGRMAQLMPKLQQIQEETFTKLNAAK